MRINVKLFKVNLRIFSVFLPGISIGKDLKQEIREINVIEKGEVKHEHDRIQKPG